MRDRATPFQQTPLRSRLRPPPPLAGPAAPGIRLVAKAGQPRAGGCLAARPGNGGSPRSYLANAPQTFKEKGLVECLRAATSGFTMPAPDVAGMSRTYDVAIYDIKMCGEVVTHPHLRIMSFRSEHYAKLMRAFQRSHLDEDADTLTKDSYPPHTLSVLLDGGKYQGDTTPKTESELPKTERDSTRESNN